MEMAAAMVLSMNTMAVEAYSARPDAPVVPLVERAPRTDAIRAALAAGLTRAARAVQPTERCDPSCAGSPS
jgi:endonuclease V-like protein UPF0215 family